MHWLCRGKHIAKQFPSTASTQPCWAMHVRDPKHCTCSSFALLQPPKCLLCLSLPLSLTGQRTGYSKTLVLHILPTAVHNKYDALPCIYTEVLHAKKLVTLYKCSNATRSLFLNLLLLIFRLEKYTHTVQKQKTFQVNISRKVTAYECVIIKLA